MQFIKTLFKAFIFISPSFAIAQSTLLPQGNKYQQMLDRLEIKAQRDSVLNLSFTQPFNRKRLTERLQYLLENNTGNKLGLTHVDSIMINSFFANNMEWYQGDKSAFYSKHPVFKSIYKTKANFLQLDQKDFFIAIDPILQFQGSKEQDNTQKLFVNTRGLTGRGVIANKLGFDFYLTENQERDPRYVQRLVDTFHAVPGAGFYKPFKTTAYDFMDVRGSIYFKVVKYIDVQLGFDKNFLGNGYRSLFLSDNSANMLFLKLTTRIWKFEYQNLWAQLISQYRSNPGDSKLPYKYMAQQHLGINVTKWLNLGLFENVMCGQVNNVQLGYFNPVIFLRPAEYQDGSPDKAMVGIDMKANVAKRLQFYGQFMVNEFKLSEMKSGKGWWGNKWGVQVGGKYIDVFGIKNLDIQGEANFIRPYSYSHYDTVANFSNYNQPLAHPMGANVMEGIGIIKYQPIPKLIIEAKLIAWKQGLDSAGMDYGSNILKNYKDRPADYGFKIGSGATTKGINSSLYASYQVLENLFVEGTLQYRKTSCPTQTKYNSNSTMYTLGLRMNMFRRQYDY